MYLWGQAGLTKEILIWWALSSVELFDSSTLSCVHKPVTDKQNNLLWQETLNITICQFWHSDKKYWVEKAVSWNHTCCTQALQQIQNNLENIWETKIVSVKSSCHFLCTLDGNHNILNYIYYPMTPVSSNFQAWSNNHLKAWLQMHSRPQNNSTLEWIYNIFRELLYICVLHSVLKAVSTIIESGSFLLLWDKA